LTDKIIPSSGLALNANPYWPKQVARFKAWFMIGTPQSPRNVTVRHEELFLSKKPLDTQWSIRRKSMRKLINNFGLFRYHCNRGSTNRVCVATSGKCTFVSVSATASVSVSVSFKPNPFQVHDVWSEQSAFNDSTLRWYPWRKDCADYKSSVMKLNIK